MSKKYFNLQRALPSSQLRQQLEQNSEVVELQRRVTDLQEKLREQKQRVKEYEETLRGAGGGAGKSGETTSVEASAQIDSKVRRIRRYQCVLFVIQCQFTLYMYM